MGVWRKWVFPSIRIVIWAVIAVALVQLAFFGGLTQQKPDSATPTGSVSDPQVAVTTGTIVNTVTVTGTIAQDPAVKVKSTLAGTVTKVLAATGQAVDVGTPLFIVRQETLTPTGETRVKTATVTSPAAGTLTLDVLATATVDVGGDVGSVQPVTFNVSGAVQADQLYRLLTLPAEATVAITSGPAPFSCPGLRIGTAQPDASGGAGTTAVTCTIPAGVRVFSGLQAQMSIAAGTADGVLILPITAVQGTTDSGNVWFVTADGSSEKRPVTLGLNDGTNVQIISGVAAGDTVLQFVPGAQASPAGTPVDGMPGCTSDTNGNVSCGAGG